MANVEIVDIINIKTSFTGSEYILGQESAGGTDSTFINTLESLADYIYNLKSGFVDYNDLNTATTQITHTGAEGYKQLTNDTLGAYTNNTYLPTNVMSLWDSVNNQLDFSELTLGSTVDIRVDIIVTTSVPNQDVDLKFTLGIGGNAYDLIFHHMSPKAAGTYNIVRYIGVYMGDTNTLNNPAEILLDTDSSATIQVNGWYLKISKK